MMDRRPGFLSKSAAAFILAYPHDTTEYKYLKPVGGIIAV
jgi:hypothetical protein